MKIVFMGTPDFAAASLEALIEAGHEITAVVTQPDKAKGRSKELKFPPVKECALRHEIPVMQPVKIRTKEAIAELKQYEADLYVVAAFGQILTQEILDLPKYGCWNIHASLLPKYRGASPIQHVIIEGEKQSGVTIMQMDAGIDTGDMLYTKIVDIEDEDTFETLHDKLMDLGGQAIVEALVLLEKGSITATKQQDELSTYASMIRKEMGKIDFSQDAIVINRLIRGMNPWPSAYTFYKGKQMKIWKALPCKVKDIAGEAIPDLKIGSVLNVTKDYFDVVCGQGILRIYELQLEGKKRMSAHDFLLGVKVQCGDVLGE